MAGIGRLENAERILEGVRGMIVRPAGVSPDFVPGDRTIDYLARRCSAG